MTQQQSYPFIQQLNKPDPVYKFGQLPTFYQTFIKELWRQGVVIEVLGAKTRKWQIVNQRNYSFLSTAYYRLYGQPNCSLRKPERKSLEQGHYVYITDPTQLPENTFAFMDGDMALQAQIIKF